MSSGLFTHRWSSSHLTVNLDKKLEVVLMKISLRVSHKNTERDIKWKEMLVMDFLRLHACIGTI